MNHHKSMCQYLYSYSKENLYKPLIFNDEFLHALKNKTQNQLFMLNSTNHIYDKLVNVAK